MWLGVLGLIVLFIAFVFVSAGDNPGAKASGERLERMKASPQWRDKGFDNALKRVDGSWLTMTTEFFFGGQPNRAPKPGEVTFVEAPTHLESPLLEGGRVTWFGHSTLLIELDGARVLIDPIWAERASPFSWAGPKRYYDPQVPIEELPELDAVIISHDHYDHLDRDAVKRLMPRGVTWLCPLGVGAHLEAWGVAREHIVELDWWQDHQVGPLKVTATPSRHFSGRALLFTDQNATLWAGWAIAGARHRVFYSGDTALHPEFKEIGERLGPFDLTIMETGAYDALWADVHLGPEQAVLAHQLVGGALMMPVHWGTYDLALHGWIEPIERVLVAAESLGVKVVVPKPGGAVMLGEEAPELSRWWPEGPWRSVAEAPAWSTSVEALQAPLRASAQAGKE